MSAAKGSIAHQIEMAVVRETLRRAVVPSADACGKSCDCTAECERDALCATIRQQAAVSAAEQPGTPQGVNPTPSQQQEPEQ